jgi:hypothetical protein
MYIIFLTSLRLRTFVKTQEALDPDYLLGTRLCFCCISQLHGIDVPETESRALRMGIVRRYSRTIL